MSTLDKFQTVISYLNKAVLEREDHIPLVVAACIAKQHVFLLGPPGTAKSMLVNEFVKCFQEELEVFYTLMAEETTRSEIFGPPSVSALKQDRYEFKYEGYLPTADYAFLDEIWKAGPGVLNSLLTAMNERKFDAGGGNRIDIPLKSLFCASNELPQDSSLDALYDRMAVRLKCPPLMRDSSKLELIRRQSNNISSPPEVLNGDIMEQAYQESSDIKLSDKAEEKWVELDRMVKEATDNQCYVSPRRWMIALDVLKRIVWLHGGDEIEVDDFVSLTDMLWYKPEQRTQILGKMMELVSPIANEAYQLYDKANALYDDYAEGRTNKSDLPELYEELKNIKDKFSDLDDSNAVNKFYKKFEPLMEDIRKDYLDYMDL